jgi:hypothetical protein
MTNKALLTAATAATLSALTILGCSAATASTSSAKPAAKPAAGAAAEPTPATHLTAYTTNDGPTEQVILTGAVADYGPALSVNPDGSTNPEHNSQLELQLQRGTFRLDIAAIDKAFVAEMGHQFPTDPATCSGSLSVTQRAPIVSGSGTGAYRNVAGDFTLTLTLDEVDKAVAGQACDGSQAFLSQMIVTTGSGNVRL